MPNLLGSAPNQCPTNADLGKLAFMDVVDTVTNNPYLDTAISDTKPSLLLDFANSKTLDPRIAYTRASTATYFDTNGVMQTAAAGVPRFDHDPVTGESKGFLIEEQRTNLLTYSDQFDAAWSVQSAALTSNTIVAPDGTLTGDKLVDNTVSMFHRTYRNVTVVSGTAYTLSVYAKAAGRSYIQLCLNNGFYVYANFDLQTGAVGTNNANATITSVGNGWYRCSITATSSGTNGEPNIVLVTSSSASNFQQYTGDGYSGIYIWGAQLEAGSFATSYIPTTSAQVTRSADSASMTGTNFSSWYNQAEGTLYGELTCSPRYRFPLLISDGTANNRAVQIYQASATQFSFVTAKNNVNESDITVTVGNTNANAKFSYSFARNNFAACVNNSTVATDTLGDVAYSDRLQFGMYANETTATQTLTIKKLAYYPKRLSDAELQEMTQ